MYRNTHRIARFLPIQTPIKNDYIKILFKPIVQNHMVNPPPSPPPQHVHKIWTTNQTAALLWKYLQL